MEESNNEVQKAQEMKKALKKRNPWLYSTVAMVVLLAIVVVFSLSATPSTSPTGMVIANQITAQEAADNTVDFINNNLIQSGEVSFVSVETMSGIYKVTTSYQGQEVVVHVTKDGKYLFLPQSPPVDMSQEVPQATTTTVPQPSAPTAVSADDDPVKGDDNAPVTIIEFSDFQCPFCARFYEQTLPQIEEEYIKTGKVKFVYRDFPLTQLHPQALKAAEAGECADEQGKFWEYHDKLFENQNALDIASLKQYAKDLGLDTTEFNSCLDSGKYASEVQKDLQDGQSYGVRGTPAFFINGILVSGAQPFAAFKQIIDTELSK